MVTDVALWSALTGRLAARSGSAIESLTELVGQRIGSLGSDEVEREWIRSSVQANIELLLQVMSHPDDLSLVEPPLGGVALVRRIAQHDVPFYELVRAYHLAEWYWIQLCMTQLAALTADVGEHVRCTREVSDLVHSYIDLVCRRLSVVYEVERDRWRSQEESARIGPVTAVLTGAVTDIAEAEAGLGYRLGQSHLAVIVWFTGRHEAGEEFVRIKRASAELARRCRSRGRPLMVARDHTTLWVWLPVAGEDPSEAGAVARTVAAQQPGIRIALGEPSSGIEGFVASHRQAVAAHEIGLAAGADVGAVFPYREVSSLTLLCADLPRARDWVAETLSGLASTDRRTRDLRRTLQVYSAANRSTTAAARLMNCHKNTVQYRIRSAERLLGHRVEDSGLELDLALLACHWLGEAVSPLDPDRLTAWRPGDS